MKATINRKQFSDALATVIPVLNPRAKSEIIKSAKMTVDGDGISLLATDSEITMQYRSDANIEGYQPGTILLPPERTMAVLREATAETVTFSDDKGALRIESHSNWWIFPVPDVAEFPDFAPQTDGDTFRIPVDGLRSAIQRTIFAAEDASPRYGLSGICVDVDNHGQLTLVATDSRRMALVPVPAEGEAKSRREVLPKRAMKVLLGALRGEDPAALTLRKADAVLKCGPVTLHCRMVEGRFPNFPDVLPSSFDETMTLAVDPFQRAVRQSMAVLQKEQSAIDLQFGRGTLAVRGAGEEVGLADVRVDVKCDSSLKITFDSHYVSDFLKQLDSGGEFEFKANGPNAAAVFEADGDYRYVLMPLADEK